MDFHLSSTRIEKPRGRDHHFIIPPLSTVVSTSQQANLEERAKLHLCGFQPGSFKFIEVSVSIGLIIRIMCEKENFLNAWPSNVVSGSRA